MTAVITRPVHLDPRATSQVIEFKNILFYNLV